MGVLWGWVTQLSGLTNPAAAIVLAAGLIAYGLYQWSKNREKQKMPGIQLWHVWTVSIVGAWIFISATLGLLLFSVLKPSAAQVQGPSEGPLTWFYNLSMTPGPNNLIYNFGFRGANTSQTEVTLAAARLISANTGATINLKVEAEGSYLNIDGINPIPPGAPVNLLADFTPGGLPREQFIKDWSKFTLYVRDDQREYRLPFNEGNIAPFFPGLVGPHITEKK
jgi:hypothetical protein